MKDFNQLLKTLIEAGAKPTSIIGFCRDLYEFKRADFEYHNAPSKAKKMARYSDYIWYYNCVSNWLKAFHLQAKYLPHEYIPEDFIEL